MMVSGQLGRMDKDDDVDHHLSCHKANRATYYWMMIIAISAVFPSLLSSAHLSSLSYASYINTYTGMIFKPTLSEMQAQIIMRYLEVHDKVVPYG